MMNKTMAIWLKTTTALTSILVVSMSINPAHANPKGGKVVEGDVKISQPNSSTVQVNQNSQKAIVDWRSFDIAPNETTRFVQPNSRAWILNRVNGSQNPTTIQGRLEANGNVAIVNPDGILFSQGASVDVNSLIATTHNISNDDFMAGRMNFHQPGNLAASVINEGTISIGDHGLGAFVAPGVRNSGVITARFGSVSLAAGNSFTLDLYGDGLVNLAIGDEITKEVIDIGTGKPMSDLVKNSGTIKADGGRVALKAATARRAVNAVINNTGIIEANTIGMEKGMIVLGAQTAASKSNNAPRQKVKVSGRLQTAALPTRITVPTPRPRSGGQIEITAEDIELSLATIDASGVNGGGTILIGGDYLGGNGDSAIIDNYNVPLADHDVPTATYLTVDAGSIISADATDNGDGGKIILWSDDTTQVASDISSRGGENSGNGGFVETSGANLNFAGLVDVSSRVETDHGVWLMDPIAVVITNPDQRLKDSRYAFGLGSNIYSTSIEDTLNRGGTVHITARTPYIAGRFRNDGQERAEIDVSELDVKYNYISLDAPITVTGTERSKLIFDTSGAIFNDFTSYQQVYNRAETIYSLNAPMDVELISDTGQIRFGCPPSQGACAGLSASPEIFTNGGTLTLTKSSNITFIDDGRTITVPKPSDLMPTIYLSATSDRATFQSGFGMLIDQYGTFFETPTPTTSQNEEVQEEAALVENPDTRIKISVRPIGKKNEIDLEIDDGRTTPPNFKNPVETSGDRIRVPDRPSNSAPELNDINSLATVNSLVLQNQGKPINIEEWQNLQEYVTYDAKIGSSFPVKDGADYSIASNLTLGELLDGRIRAKDYSVRYEKAYIAWSKFKAAINNNPEFANDPDIAALAKEFSDWNSKYFDQPSQDFGLAKRSLIAVGNTRELGAEFIDFGESFGAAYLKDKMNKIKNATNFTNAKLSQSEFVLELGIKEGAIDPKKIDYALNLSKTVNILHSLPETMIEGVSDAVALYQNGQTDEANSTLVGIADKTLNFLDGIMKLQGKNGSPLINSFNYGVKVNELRNQAENLIRLRQAHKSGALSTGEITFLYGELILKLTNSTISIGKDITDDLGDLLKNRAPSAASKLNTISSKLNLASTFSGPLSKRAGKERQGYFESIQQASKAQQSIYNEHADLIARTLKVLEEKQLHRQVN